MYHYDIYWIKQPCFLLLIKYSTCTHLQEPHHKFWLHSFYSFSFDDYTNLCTHLNSCSLIVPCSLGLILGPRLFRFLYNWQIWGIFLIFILLKTKSCFSLFAVGFFLLMLPICCYISVYFSHLHVLDHQNNFNIRQRYRHGGEMVRSAAWVLSWYSGFLP